MRDTIEINFTHLLHVKTCEKWRQGGRPEDNDNPLKIAKKESRQNLQQLRRIEENNKAENLHIELMAIHANNISELPAKLKQINGNKNNKIEFIDTLLGTYKGENVLEGL